MLIDGAELVAFVNRASARNTRMVNTYNFGERMTKETKIMRLRILMLEEANDDLQIRVAQLEEASMRMNAALDILTGRFE